MQIRAISPIAGRGRGVHLPLISRLWLLARWQLGVTSGLPTKRSHLHLGQCDDRGDMKRHEALALAVACFFMLTAGLTWKFGDYGLIGPSAVALVLLLFIDTDKTDKEE